MWKNRLKIMLVTVLCCVTAVFGSSCDMATIDETTVFQSDTPNAPFQMTAIDVGQGDSILLQCDGHYMLIDAGEPDKGDTVVNYLQSLFVKELDYAVITHPHSDHYGGMEKVLKNIKTNKIIMNNKENNTKSWESLVDYIDSNDYNVTAPVVGETYALGSSLLTIVAPNSKDYKNLNNYSIVFRAVYGDTSFLLTGDAEELSEKEMLENGQNLDCDVLKVGHHGSKTSSCKKFLQAVSPDCAIISVGKDNDYGHPAKTTINRIEKNGAKVYRTDKMGTIIASSDGKDITISVAKS